jgi:cytochrome P450
MAGAFCRRTASVCFEEDHEIMIKARDFDVLSPEFHANPFPTLDRMHAEGPIVRIKLPIIGRTYLAVTHDACAALLKDHVNFARSRQCGEHNTSAILLGHDDSEHRRLRSLVDQAFARRTIETMRPMISGIVDRILDRLKGRTEVDLMAEFCGDLPLSVICAMLGLPDQDHDRFKNWLGGLKNTAMLARPSAAFPV